MAVRTVSTALWVALAPALLFGADPPAVTPPAGSGLTVASVRGFGQGKGCEGVDFEAEIVDFTDKVRVEIAAPDDAVDAIAEAVVQAAHSGRRGDGKIFVLPLERVVRIRTRERDGEALRSPLKDE
jgi:nitrogen regulatory protein PII